MLKTTEILTGPAPTASIIWLHGLGASGEDFVPIIPQLGLSVSPSVRFIFPDAPSLSVTVNGGIVMPAWYDIVSQDIDRHVNVEQLISSADQVAELIANEQRRGIASERIILAGFSQGGAVVYQAGLTYPERLGGIIGLSTYFATKDSICYHAANAGLEILVSHGTMDVIVLEALGVGAARLLKEKGYRVTYQKYPMPHSVCPQQIQDISVWLKCRLSSVG